MFSNAVHWLGMMCVLLTWVKAVCDVGWSHGEFLIVAVSSDDNKWPRKPMINQRVANTDKTPFITWSTIKIPLAIQHSLALCSRSIKNGIWEIHSALMVVGKCEKLNTWYVTLKIIEQWRCRNVTVL